MTPTQLLIPAYAQMLRGLSNWLDKARTQLGAGSAEALLSARLAPDMFPLATQIRFACMQALEVVDRLSDAGLTALIEVVLNEGRAGGEQPGSIADAQARIATTLAVLDGVAPDALDKRAPGALAIELPMGMAFDMTGEQYIRDWAQPQFYFHLLAAYAILRAGGVTLGKADYVAHAMGYLRPGSSPG
jgi:hypothetical protein